MTPLPASCPLSATADTIDTAALPLSDRCPLTGAALTPTVTTTGARDGAPVRHVRLECPQPCLTQWWEDSTDGHLSWSGSGLIVDYPDLDDDPDLEDPSTLAGEIQPPAQVAGRNTTPPGQRHGGDDSLMAWRRGQ